MKKNNSLLTVAINLHYILMKSKAFTKMEKMTVYVINSASTMLSYILQFFQSLTHNSLISYTTADLEGNETREDSRKRKRNKKEALKEAGR